MKGMWLVRKGAFLVSFLSLNALACPPPLEASLSLASVVQLAWCNHPSSGLASARVDAARAATAVASAAQKPVVTANAGVLRTYQLTPVQDVTDQQSASISASWIINDFGSSRHRTESARNAETSMRQTAEDVRSALALSTARAWLELTLAQHQLALRKQTAKELDAVLAAALGQYENGAVTRADVHQAKAAFEQSRYMVAQADAQTKHKARALSALMGVPPEELAPLESEESLHLENLALLTSLEPVSTLKSRVPILRAAEATSAARRHAVESARAAHAPVITGNLSRQWNHRDTASSGSWSAGVTLNVPLYSGGLKTAQLQEALAQEEIARQQKEEALLVWESTLISAKENLVLSEHALLAAKASLDAASASQALAQGRYAAGVGPVLDVHAAVSQKEQAGFSLLQARVSRVEQALHVRHLENTLVEHLENN